MRDDEQFLQGIKPYLSNAFEMTNINFIKFCFKIQVSKNITNHSLRLSQKQYLAYVLKHFGMLNCKLVDASLPTKKKFIKKMGPKDICKVDLMKTMSMLKG